MTWNGDWDGFAGDMDPDLSYGGSSTGHSCNYYEEERSKALYTFFSEEALVTSEVFQKHLGMSLAHKDKVIRDLENELMKKLEW